MVRFSCQGLSLTFLQVNKYLMKTFQADLHQSLQMGGWLLALGCQWHTHLQQHWNAAWS